jgi:hypothetical protein
MWQRICPSLHPPNLAFPSTSQRGRGRICVVSSWSGLEPPTADQRGGDADVSTEFPTSVITQRSYIQQIVGDKLLVVLTWRSAAVLVCVAQENAQGISKGRKGADVDAWAENLSHHLRSDSAIGSHLRAT